MAKIFETMMEQEFNQKNSSKISLKDALESNSVKVRPIEFNGFEEGDIFVFPKTKEELESRLVKQQIDENFTVFLKVDTYKKASKSWTLCNFYPSQVNKNCFLAVPVPGEKDEEGNDVYTRGERKITSGTLIDKMRSTGNALQWIVDNPGVKVKVTPTKYKSMNPVFVDKLQPDGTTKRGIDKYVVGETTINQFDIVTDELPAIPE